jgi:hypothetical protein
MPPASQIPEPVQPATLARCARHLFAGPPAIIREGGGRVRPINVAGVTPKSNTEGCAALHHVAILSSALIALLFRAVAPQPSFLVCARLEGCSQLS